MLYLQALKSKAAKRQNNGRVAIKSLRHFFYSLSAPLVANKKTKRTVPAVN